MIATGLPVAPGVFTPSEVAQALDAGAQVVKLFPASTGGPGHLRALRGPFPGLRVIPTGGIGIDDLAAWFNVGALAVGIGGELTPRALMADGRWDEITRLARTFAAAATAAREGGTPVGGRARVVTRYFTFMGVTTAGSSIMRIFPRWRDLLRLGDDIEMVGWDLPIHAPRDRYREAVARLKGDPANLGALVTTHKLDLYQAARDLFDEADHYARLCDEVSCIAKRDGRLLGWAKDPISAGRALERMLGPGYFGRTGGEVLCFGAGGSGVAIALHLLSRPDLADRPSRIVVTDRDPKRLEGLRALLAQLDTAVRIDDAHNADPRVNDGLVARLPPASLVINATGMGKDIPGSPITDMAVFPRNGIAWELNYRGELQFLRQAEAQRGARSLRVEDGWDYFIFGWTAVMEEVFNRRVSTDEIGALADAASFARPPLTRA